MSVRWTGKSLWVGLLAPLLLCSPVGAMPERMTRGEIARLPEYCPVTRTFFPKGFPENPAPEQQPWIALMGPTFWTMHHYCWAMIYWNRAKAAGVPAQTRKYYYNNAIADSHFVIEHSEPGFILLPEIYLRMGQFALALEEPVRAIDYFQESRRAKPDYWPAYVEEADVHARIGRRQLAIELLREGLRLMPGQAQLTDALRRAESGTDVERGRAARASGENRPPSSASAAPRPQAARAASAPK
jgi:tetratricopeptide (TPR) repeat protein